MKKIIIAFVLCFSFIGYMNVEALNDDFVIVDVVEKYYKTETIISNNILFGTNSSNAITTEISKEEYENENIISPNNSYYTETEYKKMIVSISKNSSKYRYKVELNWKKTPKVRSYYIIGLYFYKSVKPSGSINFSQRYCYSSNNCKTDSTATIRTQSDGVTATFKLPSDSVTNLSSTLYFDVEKATTETIIRQTAIGDYSHATKSITLANAKKHSINSKGINLDSSITSYYDSIDYAQAMWNGTW